MDRINAVFKLSSQATSVNVHFYEPNQCPLCKKNIKPVFVHGLVNDTAKSAYVLFECRACFKAFIKSFSTSQNSNGSYWESGSGSNPYLAPNPPEYVSFSKYINELSPAFVEIYNQANAAECYNLNEIAGIGYRKSAEFLIKDYLMSTTDDESQKENIKTKFLLNCINDDVTIENLKIVARRITWLGNDEAHYIRKHTDTDVTDLKRLIEMAVRWIETECMTREAEKDIQHIK